MSEPLSVRMGCINIFVLEPNPIEPTVSTFRQNGTDYFGVFYGAAAGSDGSVILCGYIDGSWDADSYVSVKLDSDGEEVWRFKVISP